MRAVCHVAIDSMVVALGHVMKAGLGDGKKNNTTQRSLAHIRQI